jgi:ABC-type phosphate/phosphonate transport system ATPase subunit
MDVTMIGLQNAGKTSLLRVLAVSILVTIHAVALSSRLTVVVQGGEFTIEYVLPDRHTAEI